MRTTFIAATAVLALGQASASIDTASMSKAIMDDIQPKLKDSVDTIVNKRVEELMQ
jgi:hypothetical protein